MVEGWVVLGEIGLILEDPAGARGAYSRALGLRPNSLEGRIGLGWSYLVGQDPTQAAQLWRPLIGATSDPHTLTRMVDVYHALGDASAEAEARARLARIGGGR